MNELQKADILLSLNYLDEDNTSPGYWNHAALYVGNHQIIEAQAKPGKVITSSYVDFYNRYKKIVVMRYKLITPTLEHNICTAALSLVGTPYWKLSSIFNIMRRVSRGVNCVAVVRRSFKAGLKQDFGWKIPDNIYLDRRLEVLYEKDID